jgi:HSP20 family protein
MQEQFNRIFNESFGRGIRSRGFMPAIKGSFFEPDIDIREEQNNYIVKIDLPGMEKDNINIEVKDNILTVSGERETVVEENKGDKFFRQERSYGHFSRSFPLPDDVKEDQITADYKNGVLTVKIAKVPTADEKEKESKKIKVF